MTDNNNYDLIIVGAGIHGAAIAHEAARQGRRVLLIEQFDTPAQGTSSKSSKLIHGGLRYLESFEFGLVYECLSDRRRLLTKYPDLVSLQKFYIPIYAFTSRASIMVRTGLSLYALLGGLKKSNRFVSIKKTDWGQLDGLNTDKLKHVYQYYDAQTDDAKLTRRLIDEAVQDGATVQFSSEFLQCEALENGVSVSYRQGDGDKRVAGKYLINAAGPWVNRVVERCVPTFSALSIDLVQGTHIELPGQLQQGIYYLESPTDRRAVFAMPWRNHIMVGTTETIYTGDPAAVKPTAEEIEYLLDVYNHYFSPAAGALTRQDVLASWAGLRVLPSSKDNPFQRTRETIFHRNNKTNPRIFSIYGGKLTSHYSTAVKLLKLL